MPDARTRAAIKRQVLAFLRNHGQKAFRSKEISKTLGYNDNRRYKLFRDVLQELDEAGLVARAKGGRYSHRKKQRERNAVEGRLSVNPNGYGFVSVEELDGDVYVKQHRLKTALDGDLVRIALAAPTRGSDKGREGEVVEVVERGRTQTVGTFDRMGHFAFVKPDDTRLTHDIYVPREAFNGAEEGDKVVVSIDVFDDPKASPEGRVLEVIGPADAPGVAVLALARAQGVRSDFPDEVEQAAAQIPVAIPDAEANRRLDLRDKRIFTIDPIDAKDFDDAIHITRLESGDYELGVHIADVSHFVPEGSALDEEAYTRGTSTYLVDRVIPMLPEKLSNEVCSLRPREDKLTYSCLMTVSARGAVKDYQVAETLIHSHERFTYEEAQTIIDGGSQDHPLRDDVLLAAKLARLLTKKRLSSGSIDFDLPEVRVVLDDAGQPVDVIKKERKEANRLIEEFMLLANKSVAEHVGKKLKKPFVYRVHGSPDGEKIKTLAEYVRSFGYHLSVKDGVVSPKDLNALLQQVKGTAEEPVIEVAAVQAMSKAVYSANNEGHFGLGFRLLLPFHEPHSPLPRPDRTSPSQAIPRRGRPEARHGGARSAVQAPLRPGAHRHRGRAREHEAQAGRVRRSACRRHVRRRGRRRDQLWRVRRNDGAANPGPRPRARHGQRLLGVRHPNLRARRTAHPPYDPTRRPCARTGGSGER